jgi:small subunit ribosomal protein S19
LLKTKNNNKQKILLVSRNSQIIPKFLGLTFNVYNGKNYVELIVTENMIGHKFGEFSFTRANFAFKKKAKKK